MAKKEKDPATLFYWNDFMTGTMGMHPQSIGCYMKLLVAQFNIGPLNINQVKEVLGVYFETDWHIVKSKFVSEDGLFYNEKLKSVMEDRKNHKQKQSENAKKRYDKLEDSIQSSFQNDAKHGAKHDAKTMPLGNGIEIEIEIEDEYWNFKKAVGNLQNVSSLRDQVTRDEFEKLVKKFPKQLIWETLLAMENKKDLTKKYISVYLTLNNWIKNSNGIHKQTNYPRQNEVATEMGEFFRGVLQNYTTNNNSSRPAG